MLRSLSDKAMFATSPMLELRALLVAGLIAYTSTTVSLTTPQSTTTPLTIAWGGAAPVTAVSSGSVVTLSATATAGTGTGGAGKFLRCLRDALLGHPTVGHDATDDIQGNHVPYRSKTVWSWRSGRSTSKEAKELLSVLTLARTRPRSFVTGSNPSLAACSKALSAQFFQ
jgi:hypothetical protein